MKEPPSSGSRLAHLLTSHLLYRLTTTQPLLPTTNLERVGALLLRPLFLHTLLRPLPNPLSRQRVRHLPVTPSSVAVPNVFDSAIFDPLEIGSRDSL